MKRFPSRSLTLAALLDVTAVLLFHSAAQAQQADSPPSGQGEPHSVEQASPLPPQTPPPPPAPPPPQMPPPPYGPPPGYGSYPPPSYYPPPAPSRSLYRPFTLGLGLGLGGLNFRDAMGRVSEPGLSYTMHLGFGITRNWLVFMGLEGTHVDHAEHGIGQTSYLMGAQFFVISHLYLRAGLGLSRSSFDDGFYLFEETGQTFLASVGFEFAQGYNTSLAVELVTTASRYPGNQTWTSTGLNFVLNFF